MDTKEITRLAESLLDRKEGGITLTLWLAGFSSEETTLMRDRIAAAKALENPTMEIIRIILDALNYRRWRIQRLMEGALDPEN